MFLSTTHLISQGFAFWHPSTSSPMTCRWGGVAISLTPWQHYKDNTWVAGYNPLNEPTDSEHTRLIAFYERVEKAIRAIDPHHILFLE